MNRKPPVDPMAPPPDVLARAHRQPRVLARLRGRDETQNALASSVRTAMIRAAVERRDHARAAVLRAVADPSWFIRHAKTAYLEIRWPSLSQLADPDGVDEPAEVDPRRHVTARQQGRPRP